MKQRDSKFELLRILAMMMVVTVHFFSSAGGGALKGVEPGTVNFYFVYTLEHFASIGVILFLLVSGYYGIKSTFRLKKALSLYLLILFYAIIFSLFFWLRGSLEINLLNISKSFLPVTNQTWWFMSVYLILYLLSPYINKLLLSLSKKEFTYLLALLLFIFNLWPTFGGILNHLLNLDFRLIDATAGYSLYNFIFIYSIGAYIRLFYDDFKIKKRYTFLIYILASSLLSIASIYFTLRNGYILFNDYNFTLLLISGLAMFMFFKELKVPYDKDINLLASLTLGVYLIHEHFAVKASLYNYLNYKKYFDSDNFIIVTIAYIIVIYAIASVIEYIRQLFVSKILKRHNLLNKLWYN